MAIPVNSVIYSLMLYERGVIESDVMLAHHGPESFMVISSISQTNRDHNHLKRNIRPNKTIWPSDATSSYGVLSLAGPKARDLSARITELNLSGKAFPFNSLQRFNIGHAPVFAQQLSYTSEHGWEILITPDFAEYVFEVIMNTGLQFGLKLVGSEALNALRIEKDFLHWGHDMSHTEVPQQIGLNFTCKRGKSEGFYGKDAFIKRKAQGNGLFLCSIKLCEAEAVLHRNKPVLRNEKIIDLVTIGVFSQTQNSPIGLCFLSIKGGKTALTTSKYSVMVEGRQVPAPLSLKQFMA